MPAKAKTVKKQQKALVAIGDAHGDYHAFAAVLIDAGLMDAELNWTGGKTTLVQMGDILDRGQAPLQIDGLLDMLGAQAKKAGGRIVRLVGNHELEILRKNYFITSLPYFQIEPFRYKLIKGILSGAWQAAYGARGFLFTHAGVCDFLFTALKQEINKPAPTITAYSAHINKVFKEAVKTGSYRHPIFNVSYIRGGSDQFGGIFWEDLSSLFANHQLCTFKQIVGHTAIPEVLMAPDERVIAIDVGMKKVFLGQFEYLNVKTGGKIKTVKLTGGEPVPPAKKRAPRLKTEAGK